MPIHKNRANMLIYKEIIQVDSEDGRIGNMRLRQEVVILTNAKAR